MTTPADNTPNAILQDAYVDAGLIQDTDELSGEQLAKGLRRLRDVINFLQTRGLKLWTWQDVEVTLTSGTATYTFFPQGSVDMTKPLRVLQGFYLYTDTNVRRAFSPLSMNEYYNLGQAGTLSSNQGAISQYYVEKLSNKLQVTFWLCPDDTEADNGSAHLIMQTQITNPVTLDETMQFPPEWRIGLRWALANDLATGQPQAVIDRCKENMAVYIGALEDWDVEDTPVQFQVDATNAYPARSFT